MALPVKSLQKPPRAVLGVGEANLFSRSRCPGELAGSVPGPRMLARPLLLIRSWQSCAGPLINFHQYQSSLWLHLTPQPSKWGC